MATDLEKLVVQMSADIKSYEREMRKARGVSNREARAVETRFRQMNRNLDGIMAGGARAIIAPLAGISAALSVREVARYADAWTSAKNSLAVAGVVGQNQVFVLEQIYQAAQANFAPLGALASLYGRAAQASDSLGASQADLIKFSGGVGTALRVAGTNATAAQGALTQLGQAISSTRVFAEEFNSINEGARPILIAVAAGMDEAGGSVSKLRQMVIDGKVSGQQFFQAFLTGLPKIQSMAANATTTIDQGMTKVNNAFTKYIGQTDEGLGASQRLVEGLSALADNFDAVADVTLKVAGIIAGALVGRAIGGMVTKLGLATAAATKFIGAIRAATTISGVASAISGLSAAAGLLGLVLGGAAVTALTLYASSSEAAEARTVRLRAEMESLGLVAPAAAKAVDQVAASVDNLTNAERLARVRDLRDEIAAVGGGFMTDLSGGASLSGIRDEAGRGLNGGWVFNEYESGDSDALRTTREMSEALRQNEVDAAAVIARMDEIANTDMSAPARKLITDLRDLAEYYGALQVAQRAMGDAPEVRAANLELAAMREQLQALVGMPGVDEKIVAEVVSIIDSFESGERASGDLQRALVRIADADPAVAQYIAKLLPLFNALKGLREQAAAATAALPGAGTASGGRGDGNAEVQRRNADGEAQRAGAQYIAEAARLNSLTRDQLALENERARVLKDLPTLTAAQADEVARSNTAADARRSAEGKKGPGGGSADKDNDYTNSVKDTLQQIAGMKAEAEALLALNGAYNGAGNAADYARKRAELLTAAQQAGMAVTPELTRAVDDMARAYASAGYSAEEAQAALDRVKERAEAGANAIADIFTSIVSGSTSAKDAVADLLMQLARVQAQQAFLGMGGAGGVFGWLGGALGGARANGGSVKGGVPYLVNERTARSEVFVPSQSGGILNVPQAQAALARSIPDASTIRQGANQPVVVSGNIAVTVDGEGKIRAYVESVKVEAANYTNQAIGTADKNLPQRMRQVNRQPRGR